VLLFRMWEIRSKYFRILKKIGDGFSGFSFFFHLDLKLLVTVTNEYSHFLFPFKFSNFISRKSMPLHLHWHFMFPEAIPPNFQLFPHNSLRQEECKNNRG